MVTSPNGNMFRVTGTLCGEFTGHQWITPTPHPHPPTKDNDGALVFSLICAWIIGWVNNREAGDLRRHRTDYDVTVMRLLTAPLPWNVSKSFARWYPNACVSLGIDIYICICCVCVCVGGGGGGLGIDLFHVCCVGFIVFCFAKIFYHSARWW